MKINTESGRTFFYILLSVALLLAYFLLEGYIATIVFSIVIVVMFKPAYDFFLRICRYRSGVATSLTILFVFLTLLIPVFFTVNVTVTQANRFQKEISSIVSENNVSFQADSLKIFIDEANNIISKVPFTDDYQLTEEKVITAIRNIVEPVAGFLANKALDIGTSSADWIAKFIIFISILAVLFPAFPNFIKLLKDLSPLDDALDQRYIDRVTAMTKSMVKGVFIIAFVQGLVTGLLFWITGIDYVLFFTLIAVFLSILPMGAQFLSIPAGIILLLLGKLWQGIVLIAGSALIVGNIDNVLRPYLVPRETELNAALLLLSAFGGLNLFGFLGIIYGPVLMIFLVTTIEIYLEYYQVDSDKHKSHRPQRNYRGNYNRSNKHRNNSRRNNQNQTKNTETSSDSPKTDKKTPENKSADTKPTQKKDDDKPSRPRQNRRRRRPPNKKPDEGTTES